MTQSDLLTHLAMKRWLGGQSLVSSGIKMIFPLSYADHSVSNRQELRQWFLDNGLLHSEFLGASLLDAVAETVTVRKRVPMAGQENEDFPEYATDENGEPVTIEQVIPLTVPPLRWMLTMTGVHARQKASTATW